MKITYEKLDALIESAVAPAAPLLSFCLYEDVEENEDFEKTIIELPFGSIDDIFVESPAVFHTEILYYDPKLEKFWRKPVKSKKFINPTWKDVIKVANKFASGEQICLGRSYLPRIHRFRTRKIWRKAL